MAPQRSTRPRSGVRAGVLLVACLAAACATVEVPAVPASAGAEPWPASHVVTPDAPGSATLEGAEAELVAQWLQARTRHADDAPPVRLDVLRLGERASTLGLVAGVLTAGLATLVGVPSGSWEVDVGLRLSVGDVITSGHGNGRGSWALWWGLDWDDARRQARLQALAAALACLDEAAAP